MSEFYMAIKTNHWGEISLEGIGSILQKNDPSHFYYSTDGTIRIWETMDDVPSGGYGVSETDEDIFILVPTDERKKRLEAWIWVYSKEVMERMTA